MGEQIRVVGMLPARLRSSRLPEKALVDIEGYLCLFIPVSGHNWRKV